MSARWIGFFVVFGIGFCLCLSALFPGGARIGSRGRHYPIAIPSESLFVGTQWIRNDFRCTLPLRNVTNSRIQIDNIRSSCICTEISPRALAIDSGASSEIQATLDLSRLSSVRPLADRLDSENEAPFTVDLLFEFSNAGVRPMKVTLSGTARAVPIIVNEGEPLITFGESLIIGRKFSSKKVRIQAARGITIVAANCDPEFAVTALETAKPPEDEIADYYCSITPNDTLPVGEHAFVLWIHGRKGGDLAELPPVPVRVVAKVCETVYALPSQIIFGSSPIGSVLSETVTIRSRDHRAIKVLNVTCRENCFAGTIRTAGSDGYCFEVSQKIVRPGPQRDSVAVRVHDEDLDCEMDIVIPILYRGI